MTWLASIGRFIDPTRKKSFTAGALRAIDPTNKNSLVGKVAPYAVGAIPGIGLPLAMGLGAGIRGAQAVRRGEGIGAIAGSAVQGASEAGLTRGIAGLTGIGRVAAVPGDAAPLGSLDSAGLLPGATNTMTNSPVISGRFTPRFASIAAENVNVPGPMLATTMPPALTPPPMGGPPPMEGLPNRSFLGHVGDVLLGTGENRTGIAPLIGEAAKVYGAYETGRAEDAALALRREEMDRRYHPRRPYDQWDVERQRLRTQYGYGQ